MADFSFKLDDRVYDVHLDDVNGLEARAFRIAVGVPMVRALEGMVSGQVDALEIVAGFKWIIDRRDDPKLTFDKVLGSINYGSFSLDVEEQEEPEEDFPTQGAASAPASPPSPASTDSSPGTSNDSPLANSLST